HNNFAIDDFHSRDRDAGGKHGLNCPGCVGLLKCTASAPLGHNQTTVPKSSRQSPSGPNAGLWKRRYVVMFPVAWRIAAVGSVRARPRYPCESLNTRQGAYQSKTG